MALLNREIAEKLAAMGVDVAALFRAYALTGASHCATTAVWTPAADVCEAGHEVIIKLELSGLGREPVTLTVNENLVVVRGVRHDESPGERSGVGHMEIEYGVFEKRIWLPWPVKTQGARTQYDRGFLTIVMQKARRPVVRSVCVRVSV